MLSVKVGAAKPYEVLIDTGLIDRAGELLLGRVRPARAAIVGDETVADIYGGRLSDSLGRAGIEAHMVSFPPGESSKSIAVLSDLLEAMADIPLTRTDVVVALGGGVSGDIAGLAAAMYLRGIACVQVPTSLLAMVDSSVGGKTGINLKRGKNLAGAFWQPELVLCDVSALGTLPEEHYVDGLAEMIKYGVIADKRLFDALADGDRDNMAEKICRCVEIKAELVARDELDRGDRRLLNLGHSFGHAIELLSGYGISHGRAVASGMVMAARLAEALGIAAGNCAGEIARTLKKNGLPAGCAFGADELADAMLSDKKRAGDTLSLVLPEHIGKCVIYDCGTERLPGLVRLALDGGEI